MVGTDPRGQILTLQVVSVPGDSYVVPFWI